MAVIEALYIFDEHNNLIVSHKYLSSATPPQTVISLYLAHAAPRPSLLYLPSTSPPTILHSLVQDSLLFLSPSLEDTEPLAVLEFLHRVADALEEFVGSPLLATKITSNYDVVAQVISEVADGGIPCQSEANALRDIIEIGPGVLNNLLGNLGIQGSAPSLPSGAINPLQRPQLPALSSQGSAVPWRRSNVRHTSNEMYVDIVEDINAILAPSGRPLSGFANGSIAFTSKVSGVPDLLLTLTTGGKGSGNAGRGQQLRSVMENVVFHPCVRLNRWKTDGVMSFVPPDGRFVLCGYKVDLLGPDASFTAATPHSLDLPVNVEITTNLGQAGNEFEVKVLTPSLASKSAAQASLQSHLGRPGAFRASSSGDSKTPAIERLSVRVPLPARVRNVSELRASSGEAHWSPVDSRVEWKLNAKDLQGVWTSATLRCTLQGPLHEGGEGGGAVINSMKSMTYDYDDDVPDDEEEKKKQEDVAPVKPKLSNAERYRLLMPTAALLSFSTKGWLASGLKVESLLLDHKSSRGLGADVKPYKGVKYLTISRDGVEARC